MFRASRLAPAILASVCGPLMATLPGAAETAAPTARPQPADIEGRWQDERRDLTLDIVRCGDQICGQVVDKQQKCGARVLSASWRTKRAFDGVEDLAGGTLDMPSRGGIYKVRLTLGRAKGAEKPTLHIYGAVNEEPSLMRRTIPLTLYLVRIGDPACTPKATS